MDDCFRIDPTRPNMPREVEPVEGGGRGGEGVGALFGLGGIALALGLGGRVGVVLGLGGNALAIG